MASNWTKPGLAVDRFRVRLPLKVRQDIYRQLALNYRNVSPLLTPVPSVFYDPTVPPPNGTGQPITHQSPKSTAHTSFTSLVRHFQDEGWIQKDPPSPNTYVKQYLLPSPPALSLASVSPALSLINQSQQVTGLNTPVTQAATPVPSAPSSLTGDDGLDLDWDDLLTMGNAHQIVQTTPIKYKVYHRGKKKNQLCNSLPDKEQEVKSYFIKEKTQPSPAKLFSTWRWTRQKLFNAMETDIDLVNDLRMEACFLPRNQNLLLQLKSRARKYLSTWDLSNYSTTQVYQMVVRAIGCAMLISPEEEKVRALLHLGYERKHIRPKHNQFLSKGQTGSSPKTGLTRLPSKRNVVSTYLRRKLMPAIAF